MAKKIKSKSNIGNIYFVDPKHLVKPKDRAAYERARDHTKKRPIMIAVEKSNSVQVSQITTVKPTEKQRRRHQMVELENTPASSGKKNYADTRTIAKSRSTNKKFQIGQDPLNNSKRKVHDEDVKKFQRARKKRWPKIK